jgi:hypothetical protein
MGSGRLKARERGGMRERQWGVVEMTVGNVI